FGRAAEVRRPGPVVALLRPDPAGRLAGLVGGADAEELAEQQILGVHGDVGLQLRLPPALGRLEAEQVVARRLDGGGRRPGEPWRLDRGHESSVSFPTVSGPGR